ncbi:reverse transcriptase domain-containing protein [Bermanella sp. R86510]|uniref:reverse transcriptase domain-containing protein n=1 Tax=unclassified Bermanella TaxID=2627862 RepID=UPI0037C828B6
MELNINHIRKAYLFVKSYAYHENLNLFLKQRVAEFETSHTELDEVFESIIEVVDQENPCNHKYFKDWLKSINYHLLPKLIERNEDKSNQNTGLFISNVRDSEQYQVSKVNYFIKAPVEIHIIEMLWCLIIGPALEKDMSKDSYGNRMHSSALNFSEDNDFSGQEVFKRYIDQYNQWRDQALEVATEVSNSGDDVALLSLDLKSYFYHVDLDFKNIEAEIQHHYPDNVQLKNLALKLNLILEEIYTRYQQVIAPRMKQTHTECKDKKCLPIGMASSSIIANWYLSEFDFSIGDDARPAYYGRYVDDIIMVFKRPKISFQKPISDFVEYYLDSVISNTEKNREYVISVDSNSLPIQQDKLILQFFDKEHSRAGLEVFKQELDERSSAFKFLPSDHIDKELDRFAYDVLYDGSSNKLRSIVGLAENETELAKYLSSHITAHRLCKLNNRDVVLPQLKQFFKGQNALQFFRLWEKIYQYSIITRNYEFTTFFYRYIESEIKKIVAIDERMYSSELFNKKVHEDLLQYSRVSISITMGLLDMKKPKKLLLQDLSEFNNFFHDSKGKLDQLLQDDPLLQKYSWSIRQSNLIRHHLVAWPLANYSNSETNLTIENDFISNKNIKLDDNKLDLSPRFIHFDEWQIFNLGKQLSFGESLNDWLNKSIEDYKSKFIEQDFPIEYISEVEDKEGIVKSSLIISDKDSKDQINLAIANLKVHEDDIESAIRADREPNLSFNRQKDLYSILNSALSENADLLVMPEVAIPVSWLPFMVAFSRRHQIGLVFGLEHWISNDIAYNLIIEALPFRASENQKCCVMTARVKNHYAPDELKMLKSVRLQPGNLLLKQNAQYHKVSWRGLSFSTYNCFELSDITHRVLFKSQIDLLFACVWNKDTNYYQHILESTVRDLHCYTVQANTSQYGGSCVLRPTKTESKTMLYVKGGNNPCVLTTKLDIKELRDFQYKSEPSSKDYFKHLPPGYDSDAVLSR